MFCDLKYSLVIIFICSCSAWNDNILAPEPKSKHNEGINILKSGVTNKLTVWSKGLVPYYIDDFSFDKVTRDKIRLYLSEVGSLTKLQFVELPHPPDDDKTRWVLFINRQGLLGCDDYYATKFTDEGVQKVVLGYDCLESSNGLATAVLALAGVPPEHNNPKRNSYIKIEEKNIMPDKLHLFNMIEEKNWPFIDLDYDFGSASHYDFYMYSVNGHMTINPVVQPIQSNGGLSPRDILKIKSIYDYLTKESLVSHHDCSKMFRLGSKGNESASLNSEIPKTDKNNVHKNILHQKLIRPLHNRYPSSDDDTAYEVEKSEQNKPQVKTLNRRKKRKERYIDKLKFRNKSDFHSDE